MNLLILLLLASAAALTSALPNPIPQYVKVRTGKCGRGLGTQSVPVGEYSLRRGKTCAQYLWNNYNTKVEDTKLYKSGRWDVLNKGIDCENLKDGDWICIEEETVWQNRNPNGTVDINAVEVS